MNSICIGIDFGTTNTLVSYIENNSKTPTLSRLGRGNDSVPTTIHINASGIPCFGDEADDLCEYDPSGYARAFKLWLGGTKNLKRDDSPKEYSSQILTMEFLKHIREKCGQESLQGKYHIDRAVITVPVCFGPAQRADLTKAAKMAGFREVSLIPEPEAAGKAFCSLFPEEAFSGSALIVDWGGGTLDLSLVQRTEEGFKVQKAYSRGDETMGGEVLDTILWNHVDNRLRQESGIDLGNEPVAKRYALRKRIREAKEKLSLLNDYTLLLPLQAGLQRVSVLRQEWEQVISSQLEKVVRMVEDILNQLVSANQPSPSIILLVGGSSKTPRLRELLEEKTCIPCRSWDRSMEAVALGAALYGRELFPFETSSFQSEHRATAFEAGTSEEETTYRIRISEIEAKLGVKKTLKLGEEVIPVNIPSGVTEGQKVSIPSLIKEGTTYRGIITLQNDSFLQKRAEQGNKEDQYLWGMSYFHGVGIAQNINKGVKFIEMAAEQGETRSQLVMGQILYDGIGNRQRDPRLALSWFRKAYTGGQSEALEWIDKCQHLLNSSRKEFDSNRKVNEPISEGNRTSSPANKNNSCFWITFKGIISVFSIILCIIFIINHGTRGLVSIFALIGFLGWLWRGK